jgi:hypothetical protein
MLAVPGLTWWAVNTAVLVFGAIGGEGIGYAGWIAGRPDLTRSVATILELVQLGWLASSIRYEFDRLMGLSAVPSIGIAVLCAGAVVTVRGRRGWRIIVAAIATATAFGAVGALGLAAVVALLEAID